VKGPEGLEEGWQPENKGDQTCCTQKGKAPAKKGGTHGTYIELHFAWREEKLRKGGRGGGNGTETERRRRGQITNTQMKTKENCKGRHK